VTNGFFVEAGGMALHDVDGGHDHARRAIPALKAMIVTKSSLHRMQGIAFRNAFDGGDVGAVGLADQGGAGFYCAPVDVNDAGAALAGVASDMCAGKSEVIAQQVDQQGSILDIGRYRFAVDRQFDCRHKLLPGDFQKTFFVIVLINNRHAKLCNADFRRGCHRAII
jgi:hypothetical protein